jgi:hypothetical protein
MFRFTIRDLLWLTVVVALGVAWWVDRRQQESEILRRASIALPDRARWHYPIYSAQFSAPAPKSAAEVGGKNQTVSLPVRLAP